MTNTDIVPREAAASTDLTRTEVKQTPYYGGSESIAVADLRLPRLQVAHSSSHVVQEGLAKFGSLVIALDSNDPEPTELYHHGDEEGVVVHLLGKRDIWAYRDEEDRFILVDLREMPERPTREAQRGYEFAILIPSYDLKLPCAWMVKSSAMSCGQRMLTTIARAEALQPWSLAFELTTVPRQNAQGRWFTPQERRVNFKPAHVKAATIAAQLLGIPGGEA
jgi:hypothetical protein